MVLRIEKKGLYSFLAAIMHDFTLIAPIEDEVIRFAKIKDPSVIYLAKNAYFPLKEYFFKKREVLFQFKGNKVTVPSIAEPKQVFFGIRRCDLNAVKHQDMVFIDQTHDPYYEAARKNTYLLGYHCPTAPSPACFCGSLDLADFHDAMFYDKGSYMLVEEGSEKGKFLLNQYKSFFQPANESITDKKIPGSERLDKKDISALYSHPDWKKGVGLCLSCSACTTLCPTCYCFEIHDEVTAKDPSAGERKREWSSCQVQGFTRVAGDHVFRKEREERFKHRIYHQLDYFKEKNKVPLCVGCGRCIDGCPTRIDFVQIINEMK